MREERVNSDIIYNGANQPEVNSVQDVADLARFRSEAPAQSQSPSRTRPAAKTLSVGRVRLSILEKIMILLCGIAVFTGLFLILQGRIHASNVSYQIDLTNKQIQLVNQENQDLNSEVQSLSNSSRLEEMAQKYGFQIDESRVQNILK